MNFHDEPMMQLRAAYLHLHRQANSIFAEHGASADQYVVLTLLTETEELSQKELAAAAVTDANTMAAMLAILERRELIKRTACPNDARVKRVALTAAGRKLQTNLARLSQPFHERIQGCLTAGERQTLSRLLNSVRTAGTLDSET